MAQGAAGLALYRGGTTLLAPFARLLLELRARRGKEDSTRLHERLGRARIARPVGPLLWLHAASLGESLALLPLMTRLRARRFSILVSTGTPSSAQVLAQRLPGGMIHQFAPLDVPGAVCAFLNHWKPQALLLAESEIWPNTIRACAARGVPVALVNARLSDRSAARWQRVPRAARALFGRIDLCLVQSPAQAQGFAALGARRAVVAGNPKYDAPAPPADPLALAGLRAQVGARPVLVAAATHEGEEALVLHTHRALAERFPDLLTIVVPRHIARSGAIAALAQRDGLRVATRTSGAPIDAGVQVLVGDTFGEMGLWLRLASVAVIGKTFGDGGGQTPIEAARCGAPIVHGPSVHHFAEIFAALDRDGGALAADARTLPATIASLLADPVMGRVLARAAARTVDAHAGATDRTLAALDPLLAQALAAWPAP